MIFEQILMDFVEFPSIFKEFSDNMKNYFLILKKKHFTDFKGLSLNLKDFFKEFLN